MKVLISLLCFFLPLAAYGQDTRLRIGVVDTGIQWSIPIAPFLCEEGHKDLMGSGLWDYRQHGTNISWIITKDLDPTKVCLVIIKWIDCGAGEPFKIAEALEYAVTQHLSYLNLSLGGEGSESRERKAMDKLFEQHVVISIAAGNNGMPITKEHCNYYPACYPTSNGGEKHVVGNLDESGWRAAGSSNYGDAVTDWAVGTHVNGGGIIMSGTSQATAVVTNRLIKQKLKEMK